MGKRKTRSKRSLGSLPKGLPVRGSSDTKKNNGLNNPFDMTQRAKRPKFMIHNRGNDPTSNNNNNNNNNSNKLSALAISLQKRQIHLKESINQSKKANIFIDQRIGEEKQRRSNNAILPDDNETKNMARLVRERMNRSKKNSKYQLNDDDNDEDILTHRGHSINEMSSSDHQNELYVSDDDEGNEGNLDAIDTLMHFGGGSISKDKIKNKNNKNNDMSSYGPTTTGTTTSSISHVISDQYGDVTRKMELDDLILRRKLIKADRIKIKDEQNTKFEQYDESFQELASMLSYRDKRKEEQDNILLKKKNQKNKQEKTLKSNNDNLDKNDDDDSGDEWDKEMKEYLYSTTKKVKATDRIKTVEEIAKDEYIRLHDLEKHRLARMNGEDIEDIDDIDDNDDNDNLKSKKKKKKLSMNDNTNAEELDDDSDVDDDDDDELITTRFTSEGLVHVDKNGIVIGKVGDTTTTNKKNDDNKNKQISNNNNNKVLYKVGTKVNACYHANEESNNGIGQVWYSGIISKINNYNTTYHITYDDGDYEENVETKYIQLIESNNDDDEDEEDDEQNHEIQLLSNKKNKQQQQAKIARSEIPYVFEVPTTLDSFHEIISKYARTGNDVTEIIDRIHKNNSVRLDQRNLEKMQNFYDVLIRRYIAVGDAIYQSGNGGNELNRYEQLNSLNNIMYDIAQESPDCAASVWSRRIGYLQKAHMKRLRDLELIPIIDISNPTKHNKEVTTAWPSSGVLLLLRVIGHIFPVTDKKHPIIMPTILFLCQILTSTPILSTYDMIAGLYCCGILIEYTKEAKRIVPEVHGFLASIIRLFASNQSDRMNLLRYPLPNVGASSNETLIQCLREQTSKYSDNNEKTIPMLSLEKEKIDVSNNMSVAILHSALHFSEIIVQNLAHSLNSAEKEAFVEITESVLCLHPKNKLYPLPKCLQIKVSSLVLTLQDVCQFDNARVPLQRRLQPIVRGVSLTTYAPLYENPDKFSLSKDKGKNAKQIATDRVRREYKREHKAVTRELRLDGTYIEHERRIEVKQKLDVERSKRNKAYAWLENEQATINQQVRQGGGLLQGGGMGAAKMKARTNQLGIKKGGKF